MSRDVLSLHPLPDTPLDSSLGERDLSPDGSGPKPRFHRFPKVLSFGPRSLPTLDYGGVSRAALTAQHALPELGSSRSLAHSVSGEGSLGGHARRRPPLRCLPGGLPSGAERNIARHGLLFMSGRACLQRIAVKGPRTMPARLRRRANPPTFFAWARLNPIQITNGFRRRAAAHSSAAALTARPPAGRVSSHAATSASR